MLTGLLLILGLWACQPTPTTAKVKVTLEKVASPKKLPEPGGNFTYTLTITNNSSEEVSISALTDTQSDETEFSNCTALIGTKLAKNASNSCTYSVTRTEAGVYPNKANVTVQATDGAKASDSAEESVEVTANLSGVALTFTNEGAIHWVLESVKGASDVATIGAKDPTLTLSVGTRYTIINKAGPGHPFQLLNGDTFLLSEFNEGTFENDPEVDFEDGDGFIRFTLTQKLADEVDRYNCIFHSEMSGAISLKK